MSSSLFLKHHTLLKKEGGAFKKIHKITEKLFLLYLPES